MNYIKQKRNQIDHCNICGRVTQLTWDHVPPKAVLVEKNTYANTLFSESELPSPDHHMRHYQSGIKYRTVCAECNNEILGKNDIAYKDFIDKVTCQLENASNAMQSGIVIPSQITVKTKINRVLRSICGHFLAMKTVYDDQTIIDMDLREYVLDESIRLEKVRLFCWLYPYSTIVNFRDVTLRGHRDRTHPTGFISSMASNPLGFIISTKDETDCGVDDLGRYSSDMIDDTVPIALHFETAYYAGTFKPKHFVWPANISDDGYGAMFVLGNDEFMEGSRIGVAMGKT